MSNVSNVTASKPKTGGAVSIAPLGSTLPTSASTELDKAFTSLGYISEDGLTNANSPEIETVKAWGGDTVLTSQTSREDTFSFTLIEALDVNVLKTVYGDDNVSGTLAEGITIKANNTELKGHCYVIDVLLSKGTVLKRTVIPNATVSEVGDLTENDTDPIGYETTLTALPDGNGNTHYTYIVTKGE